MEHSREERQSPDQCFPKDEEQNKSASKSDSLHNNSDENKEHASTQSSERSSISDFIPSIGTSNPPAFDVHVQEVPADLTKPFEVKKAAGDALPVCSQLLANHKTSHFIPRHHEISRSSTSSSENWPNLNTLVEDLCASVLLACLFCKLTDCALAIRDGCEFCMACVCSSFCTEDCCCDPSSLEAVVELCQCCSCAEYMEACGCSCANSSFDCSICDLCLQTSECLELGMELSQLLFH